MNAPGLANGEQRRLRGGREGGREEGGKLCLTKEVSCNVVTDDHGDGEKAPEESLKNILSDKVGL